MNCNDAMAALVASLENGTTLSDEERAHIRTCPRCSELLAAAKELVEVREPAPAIGIDAALAAAEGEVNRQRMKRIITVVIGVGAVMAAGLSLLFFVPTNGAEPLGFWLYAFGMAALISAGFAIPVLILIYMLRGSARHRLYKRLDGRMISGVCRGLSEKLQLDVFYVRLILIGLLLLLGGVGFWFYVALDVAMPVHPDDRHLLLRFKLRRWWRRMMHAEQRAG
jgi:phage shock protein PspC (stress-responsive transcriptional regulator)